MSVSSPGHDGQRGSISFARLAARISVFAVLWAILSEGQGWEVGIPAVLLATATVPVVSPGNRWSLAGLARFIPYFFWNSLRGGVDVAARALNPRLPIDPAVLHYEIRLRSSAARVLMASTVTLLPGTLSADLEGSRLTVHVLAESAPVRVMLGTLEYRIADLFRDHLEAGSP